MTTVADPSTTEFQTATETTTTTETETTGITETTTYHMTWTITSTATTTVTTTVEPGSTLPLLRRAPTITYIPTSQDTPTDGPTDAPIATDAPTDTPTDAPTVTDTPTDVPTDTVTDTETPIDLPFPAYATEACTSFAKYQSACSRAAGVLPTTITVPGAAETVSVTETVAIGGEPVTMATTTTVTEVTTEMTTTTITETTTVIDAFVTTTTTETVVVTATASPNIVVNGDFERVEMEGWRATAGMDVGLVELEAGNHVLAFPSLAESMYAGVLTMLRGVPETVYTCTFQRAWKYQLQQGVWPMVMFPQGSVQINGVTKVGMVMGDNEAGVFKTQTFSYVSTGSDTLAFAAMSPQSSAFGTNEFWLDNVSCVATGQVR